MREKKSNGMNSEMNWSIKTINELYYIMTWTKWIVLLHKEIVLYDKLSCILIINIIV